MTLSEAARSASFRARPPGAFCARSRARLRGAGRRQFSLAPRILELGFALSLHAELDRPGAAADEGAQRASTNPARRRSCRAPRSSMSRAFRRSASWRGARGRHAAAGVPHLARPHAARLPRRSGSLAPAAIAAHRALHAATITDLQALVERVQEDRAQGFPSSTRSWSAGCARSRCRSSSRGGRASPPSMSAPIQPHHAQRDARALPASAERVGAGDFGGDRLKGRAVW